MLKTFCAENQEDWVWYLPWEEHVQNSLTHSAHPIPVHLRLSASPVPPWNANPTDSPTADKWFPRSKQVWECTHQCLEAQHNKDEADHLRGETPRYEPRDRAWLSTRDLRQGSRKLEKRHYQTSDHIHLLIITHALK